MTNFDWKNLNVGKLEPPPRRDDKPFSMLWLNWAAKAAAATNTQRAFVWIWLVHRAHKTKNNTVAMSNEALAHYGISRKVKAPTLRQPEAAGMITVERRVGKAPPARLLAQSGPNPEPD